MTHREALVDHEKAVDLHATDDPESGEHQRGTRGEAQLEDDEEWDGDEDGLESGVSDPGKSATNQAPGAEAGEDEYERREHEETDDNDGDDAEIRRQAPEQREVDGAAGFLPTPQNQSRRRCTKDEEL